MSYQTTEDILAKWDSPESRQEAREYSKECPVGYQCKDTDCIECMRLHREGKQEAEK